MRKYTNESLLKPVLESPVLSTESKRTVQGTCAMLTKAVFPGKTLFHVLRHPVDAGRRLRADDANHGKRYSDHTVLTVLNAVLSVFKRSEDLRKLLHKEHKEWQRLAAEAKEPVNDHYRNNVPTAKQAKQVEGVTWAKVLEARDDLPVGSAERLLLCSYTMISPLRNDLSECMLTHTGVPDDFTGNYLAVTPELDHGTLYVREYKTQKTYGTLEIDLPPEYLLELKASLTRRPRKYLFVNEKNGGALYSSPRTFATWANTTLARVLGVESFTLTLLRHLYISSGADFDHLTVGEREKKAREMGHSIHMQLKYKWNLERNETARAKQDVEPELVL